MPQHLKMLEEIYRSLRPGGWVLMLVTVRGQSRLSGTISPLNGPQLKLQQASFEIDQRADDFILPEDSALPRRNGLVLAVKAP